MSKRTHIADKLHSLGPIELKSNVIRMLILLVAFGFYMAFLSVSRTWIPVTQAEPAPTTPAEIDHQPIPKQNVVMTRDTDTTINGSVNNSESDTVYVPQSQPEYREEYTAPTPAKAETSNQQSAPTPVKPADDNAPPSTNDDKKKSSSGNQSVDPPGLLKSPRGFKSDILGAVLNEFNRLV